jgi:hypothetical protein
MVISKSVGGKLKAHLIGRNTRANRQLCLIKNPLTHPPHTFVCIQVVLYAILRDTGMEIRLSEKVPPRLPRRVLEKETCFKYASSTLAASMFGSYCLKMAMIRLDTSL